MSLGINNRSVQKLMFADRATGPFSPPMRMAPDLVQKEKQCGFINITLRINVTYKLEVCLSNITHVTLAMLPS